MTAKMNRKQKKTMRSHKKNKIATPAVSSTDDPQLSTLLTQALTLHRENRLVQAEAAYRTIFSHDEKHPEALHYMGVLYAQQGRHAEAIELYKKSLAVAPNVSAAHNNLGIALNSMERHEEALAAFQQAVTTDPEDVNAYNNLGGMLGYFDRQEEAINCFSKALKIKPDYDEAHYNLAVLLSDQKRFDEARKHYLETIKLNPHHFGALNNLGIIHMMKKELQEARRCFQSALQVNPGHSNALSQLAICLRQLCDWRDFDITKKALTQWQDSAKVVPNAFSFLMWSDDPAAQQQCARAYTKSLIPKELKPINAMPTADGERIKIAYLSADFRDHPVAHLTAELYELHDRTKFEITAIAYGSDDSSPMRQRLINAFDHFYVVGNMSDDEVARLIASKGIHIVIDLMGHTQGARPAVLAKRPAPIQVNYLGYTGSMGADFIDYILVDTFSVPPEQQPFFTEHLVHLPNCYMPSDSKRIISSQTPTRTQCGLPEKSFVFCCFNNAYKITPKIFNSWMNCLKAVKSSVLWLKVDNKFAQENLQKEAEALGVNKNRLCFASYLEGIEDHLARYHQADLFLDTYPYGAHTTANDALYAGLPILTYTGKSFISRVGGSLLHSSGLPELITRSLAKYEDLAIQLAKEPLTLAALREKLIANRNSAILFDSRAFCHNFEAALTTMWYRWRESLDHNTYTPSNSYIVKGMLEKAIALHQQGELDAAEQSYREILAINPNEADALHLFGVINAQRGDLDTAINYYHRSIKVNPKLLGAYNNLGIALYSMNKHQEAIRYLQQAIAISPNVEAFYNLGNSLYRLQQYEKALSSYQQALSMDPNHVNAQRNMKASLKKLHR